jgi:uncharacterized membrane protein
MHSIFGASRKMPAHALCDGFGTVQVVFGDEIFVKIGAYLIVCALVAIPVAAAVRLLLVELLLPWLDRQ